jgi:endonuclease G, mitochondrial
MFTFAKRMLVVIIPILNWCYILYNTFLLNKVFLHVSSQLAPITLMDIDNQLIEETVERYKQRESHRAEYERKFDQAGLLNIDSPKRVSQRLERIASNPLAKMMIAEDQKITTDQLTIISPDEFRDLVEERLIGQNDLMPVNYLEYAIRVSQSVGRVIIRNSSRKVIGYGTGSMVSPNLLITNNHVLKSIQESQFSLIEFNFQSDTDGKMKLSQSYEIDPNTFFITDKELDYTLVAVQEGSNNQPPLASFGWNRLIEEQGKVIIGEYVNIIQHPSGEPKQLALRENKVIDLLDNFIHYLTDTAPGSSGAPVFNDQWELLGLHHSGVPQRNNQGNVLTIDNKIWRKGMGESQVKWLANEGIRISRIAEHIKRQNLTVEQKKLRNQLFDNLPDNPTVQPNKPENQLMPNFNPSNQSQSVTWTIPLNVTISMGQIGASIASQDTPSSNTISIPPVFNLQQFIGENSELQAEMQLLEKVRRGMIPYYDKAADLQGRDKYYDDLAQEANTLNPQQLFKKLKDLLVTTHTGKLSYKPSTYLYPWVDLQPDLKIRSVYSKLEFTPEKIIEEDLRIEQEKNIRLQEMVKSESFRESTNFREELDLLEAQMPFNCEHVVPQSWFDKQEPMRGDLHHLFACEVTCNSFRSNTPYFDFVDFEEVIKSDCGKSERNESKFEPGNGKGEVARATLYFLMRYPGKINNTNKEYKPERLETLLKWHEEHDITEHEKHRNMAIFKKQGNRNPLIDFPQWARKIDFSLGIGS